MDASSALTPNDLFSFHILGQTIAISDSIVMMWIIMAALIILARVFAGTLKTVPEGKQNVAEIVVETINKLIKANMGEHWKDFAPYFGTLILFLFFANMAGIFNILPNVEELYQITGIQAFANLPSFSVAPPTKDLNVTGTMALMTVSLILIAGIKYKGVKGWLLSFLKPVPVMLPFHILDYATRTLSLSLRLFGNILAGYIIMEMLYASSVLIEPIIPIASFFYDLFDAGLQAYIFVFLSSVYISEAIE